VRDTVGYANGIEAAARHEQATLRTEPGREVGHARAVTDDVLRASVSPTVHPSDGRLSGDVERPGQVSGGQRHELVIPQLDRCGVVCAADEGAKQRMILRGACLPFG
jgi:hypothetical protein